jgi:hypothetical protein
MAAKVLGFMCVDADIASMIGMSPIIAGCGVHSDLMHTDALHACNESHMAAIHLGKRIAGMYRSKS